MAVTYIGTCFGNKAYTAIEKIYNDPRIIQILSGCHQTIVIRTYIPTRIGHDKNLVWTINQACTSKRPHYRFV
jgi:hypothetical protein